MQTSQYKKPIDIKQLIVLINDNVKDGIISSITGKKFFGHVTVNCEHGEEGIVELNETIKNK